MRDEEIDRGPLNLLAPAIAPPPELEDRVVGALSGRGLLRAERSPRLFLAVAAAAMLAGFLAGVAIGRREPSTAPAAAADRFVLFLEPLPRRSVAMPPMSARGSPSTGPGRRRSATPDARLPERSSGTARGSSASRLQPATSPPAPWAASSSSPPAITRTPSRSRANAPTPGTAGRSWCVRSTRPDS